MVPETDQNSPVPAPGQLSAPDPAGSGPVGPGTNRPDEEVDEREPLPPQDNRRLRERMRERGMDEEYNKKQKEEAENPQPG